MPENNGETPSSKREQQLERSRADRRRALSAESLGLVLLAILILIIAVIRYRHTIPWGAH